MNVVAELENAFLPLLLEAKVAAESLHPQFKFDVGSSSVGGKTEYQGHHVWLECIFPDAADHEADSVALLAGIKHITTEPKLCDASVEWGNGHHPKVSLELLKVPTPFTEQVLQQTAARLPELLHVFRRALEAWASRGTDA
jgi:hypothetical protein